MNDTPLATDISLDQLIEWIHDQQDTPLKEAMATLSAGDIASFLESVPPEPRRILWEHVPVEIEGEVLIFLHEEVRQTIMEEMAGDDLIAATDQMEIEDLVDVIQELPSEMTEAIVDSLDQDRRARLDQVLSFQEGTAGRLMTMDLLSVRPDVSLAVVLRWLRRHSKLPVHTDALIVTDQEQRYLGELSMEALVTSSPDTMVACVMDEEASPVQVDTPEHDVAALFEKRELVSVAVVDAEQRLIGRITIDDVIDVIREEADQQYLKSAGLDQEEDLFAPVVPSAQRRGLWLGINLITVFMAAWVIGQFEAALSQIVALAVLMPIVASMGGITGSQTLTLTIRGLALEQISVGNVRWLLNKELAVGALNGVVWSLVVALVAYLWFGDIGLAGVIAIAMILNMLVAALSGVLIPFGLKVVGIDPALSGAVILTTVTDIMGFLCFLGLASAFLL